MTRPFSAPLGVLILPAIAVVVGVVTTAVLASRSADPVAVHWDVTGAPDGFASPWTLVALVATVGLGLTVLLALVAVSATRDSRPRSRSRSAKGIAIVVTSATAMVTALGIWTLASQHDGGPAPAVGGGLAIAVGAAALGAALAALLLPRSDAARPLDPRPAEPVTLGATERVVWTGTARTARPAVLGIGVGMLVLLAVVGWAVVVSGGTAWPVLVVPAGLALLLLGLTTYAVRVDAEGLEVRAVLGVPVWRVRPDEVVSAGAVDVAPLAEFGGWGLRLGSGRRTGIVTRAGEALQVRRSNGRALVVTVDDADTAAALLTAVAARATGGGS